jgi:(heptosyl)LPS beta-1,4-glucosyltransferase
MRLSAVLAVRDEERMLEPALALLHFCDEIVMVIDDRTTDATEEIARRHTDRVWTEEFRDFSGHKNAAIAKARGEWVLIVDADERITPALAQEIEQTLDADPAEWAFEIETINYFFGRRMRHGGWLEHHTRLIRRDKAVYENEIHEAFPIPPERLGRLREGMWHFSHRTIEENLAKTVEFGGVQSRELLASGARPVRARTLFWVVTKEFVRRFIRHGGWRDGMPGIIESLYQPFSLFSVYVMLWQQQRRESLWDAYQALEREAAEHR